ncbi:MAG: M24 family metallopeptidase, partial [Promethearchaeota archaeon]
MSENQKLKTKIEGKKSKEELEKEAEEKQYKIESLRKAGKIAQDVKNFIKPKIKVETKILDIIETAESRIVELGGQSAFPVNIGINNIAAHYTAPLKEDDLVIRNGDIVKVDLGVHVDGYLVDTAFTISFNDEKLLENIIQS